MAGNASRNKGMNGEREVIHLLKPIVDKVYKKHAAEIPLLERNTLQCNQGGSDIAGLFWLALEVKRQERLNLLDWWEQSLQSTKAGQTTVLLYRQDRGKWRAQLHGALVLNLQHVDNLSNDLVLQRAVITKVDITIEDFLAWFENKVEYELLLQIRRERVNSSKQLEQPVWPPMPPKD